MQGSILDQALETIIGARRPAEPAPISLMIFARISTAYL